MESVKSSDDYDPFLRILQWQVNDAIPDSRSFVNRLCSECLKVFKTLVEVSSAQGLFSKKIRDELNNSRESLVLWADGYGVMDGNLDEKLEKSRSLQHATMELLVKICIVLTQNLEPQLETSGSCDMSELKAMISEGKPTIQSTDDSATEVSDSCLSSNPDPLSLDDIVADLKTYTSCLMELDPLIQSPMSSHHLDTCEKERNASSEWIQWTPHHSYSHRIFARFPNADEALIDRFARANWNRFKKIQTERHQVTVEQDSLNSGAELDKITLKDGTKSRDSGIGSSTHPTNSYAETVMSYKQSNGHSVRIPPLPPQAKSGVAFECIACGGSVKITRNSEWKKHIYGDLKPWLCHFSTCKFRDEFFDSIEDWTQHLNIDHGFNNGWQSIECPLCQEPTGDGKRVIVQHLSSHMEEISLASLPVIVSSGTDYSNSDSSNDPGDGPISPPLPSSSLFDPFNLRHHRVRFSEASLEYEKSKNSIQPDFNVTISTFKNSIWNRAHYGNPDFHPEEWSPED